MREKPVYLQIQDKYHEEIEIPDLIQKKKHLEEIRSLYKPIE
jgi:hypothetical protein